MSASFQFSSQALEDLDEIWSLIAKDNQSAADRVEMEIRAACDRLAKFPLMGTKREDITPFAIRFWTLSKFPNYVIVYLPETVPLQVIAVLHGRRNLKDILEKRF